MQLSARGAQKRRDESKKLQMYSKQWLPGDTLRVFYPIFWVDGKPEIAVGAIWGHSVSDIKTLGLRTAFIPSTTDFDENAMPIGQPDITYQFSKIARVFVNGAKALEEEAVQKKNWPNESTRKEALKAIEDKYDTKNNRNAVRPIIGNVQFYISTEVLSIKIVNNVPNKESIALTSAPLSNQNIKRIYDLMDDPKYAPAVGDEFFEVEWKYPAGSDKGESGRGAAPAGLTTEYRMSTQFPDAYASVMSMGGMVSRDAESIIRRATRAVDPVKVKQALTKYAYLASEYLDAAGEEDEEVLIKNASVVKELDILRPLSNQDLVNKLQSAINELEADRSIIPESIPTPVTPVAEAPVSVDVTPAQASTAMPTNAAEEVARAPVPDIPVNPAAPDLGSLLSGQQGISSLLNNPNNAGVTNESLDNVDFGATMV